MNVNGNICSLLEWYFEFLSNYEKLYAKKFDSNYLDYKDINQKEKTDFSNKNFNKLRIHEQLPKLGLNKTQMDFDAISLYTSAMWDNDSVYRKRESGYTLKHHKDDVFLNNFDNQT